MKRTRLLPAMLSLFAIVALVLGCNKTISGPDEEVEEEDVLITFASTRAFTTLANAGEIYTMNPDGSNPRRITNNEVDDRQPNLSPDRSKIVFSRGLPNHPEQEIYVMNVDGSGEKRLTDNDVNDQMPVFSPDGSRIVFMSLRDNNPELYVMDADGSNVRRITNHAGEDAYPSWSPDGTKIVFTRDGDIHVVNADGSGSAQRLTSDPAYEYKPSWSPDGSRIAFAVQLGDPTVTPFHHEVWSMNANGSDVTNLTPKPDDVAENDWDNRWPVWSRTGDYIYFQSVRPASVRDEGAPHPTAFEIFRMNPDGSNPINLTKTAGVDATPDVR